MEPPHPTAPSLHFDTHPTQPSYHHPLRLPKALPSSKVVISKKGFRVFIKMTVPDVGEEENREQSCRLPVGNRLGHASRGQRPRPAMT